MTHGPDYTINHWRLGYDDAANVNTAPTWITAEDATTDNTLKMGENFLFRVRLTEDGDGGANTLKAQFQLNGGTWTDIGTQSNSGATVVMCSFTSNFANNDTITTALLTGGALGANGEADVNTNSLAAPDATNTELLWCLRVMNFYGNETDGPSQITTNSDTIALRVVQNDGTIIDSGSALVTLTPQANDYYIGGTYVEAPVRIGPFCDGNGNLYVITEFYGTSAADWGVIKSTDGGKTWAAVDNADRPTNTDAEAIDCEQDGTTLRIIHKESGGDYWYHEFYTSDHSTTPDQWGGAGNKDQNIDAGSSTNYSVAIAARASTQVAVYRRTNAGQEHIYYRERSSGTWGSETAVDTTASTNFTGCRAVLGASGKVHIFYKDYTNGVIYHRSLDSGNSLSARETVENDASTTDTESMTPAVYWDNAGTEEIMVCVLDNSDSLLYSVVVSDDGTPETRKAVSANTVRNDPGNTGSAQPVADLVVDTATDTCYVLYANAGNTNIYRDSAVNDGGWGTDTSQLATTCDWVRGRIFTHSAGNGGAKVYGFVYDTGSDGETGYAWYGEYTIPAGGDLSVNVSESAATSESIGRTLVHTLSRAPDNLDNWKQGVKVG